MIIIPTLALPSLANGEMTRNLQKKERWCLSAQLNMAKYWVAVTSNVSDILIFWSALLQSIV